MATKSSTPHAEQNSPTVKEAALVDVFSSFDTVICLDARVAVLKHKNTRQNLAR